MPRSIENLRAIRPPPTTLAHTSDHGRSWVAGSAGISYLFRTGRGATYDDAELARIQAEHLAHHARLRESGQVVTNGPVRDQPDVSLRGLTFYRTGSLEQARQLAEADPAVRAGRLAVEIMTWYCPPGTMSKPGRAVTL